MYVDLRKSCRAWPLTTINQSVSVSMPTWNIVVGWGKREDTVMSRMQTVYPRYLVYHNKHQIMRTMLIVIVSCPYKGD